MSVFSINGKVIIVKPKLKDWEGGVIITCKSCKAEEVVKEGSFCDKKKLCVDCAQKELGSRGNR